MSPERQPRACYSSNVRILTLEIRPRVGIGVHDPLSVGDRVDDGFRMRLGAGGRMGPDARDDDIDYSILALWLLERHGRALRPDHLAEAMLSFLPYHRVFTAERAAMVNLLHGVPVAATADHPQPLSGVDRCADQGRRLRLGQSGPAGGGRSAGLRGRLPHPPSQWELRSHLGRGFDRDRRDGDLGAGGRAGLPRLGAGRVPAGLRAAPRRRAARRRAARGSRPSPGGGA